MFTSFGTIKAKPCCINVAFHKSNDCVLLGTKLQLNISPSFPEASHSQYWSPPKINKRSLNSTSTNALINKWTRFIRFGFMPNTNMIKEWVGGPGWFICPNKVHFNMMLATWRRWQVHGRHLAETFLGLRQLLVASNQTCFRSINLPTHPTGGRAGGHLAKTAPLSGLQAPPWGPRCAPPCTPKLLVASNTILLPLTKLLHFSPAIRSGPTQTCNYSKRRHWQD